MAIGIFAQFVVLRNQNYSLLGPDFIDYTFQSEELSAGHFPSVLVKPGGCAVWILLYRAVFGEHIAGYRTFCVAAIGLLPLLSGLIGFCFSGWLGAMVATGMMILGPASLYVSLLAETPATCFLAAALVAALYSGRTSNAAATYGLVLAAGLLTFLSFQSRPDYLMYAVTVAVFVALAGPSPAGAVAPAGRKLLLLACTWAVLLGTLSALAAPQYGSRTPIRYDAYLRYYTVFQEMKLEPRADDPSIRLIRSSLIRSGVRPERLSGRDDLGFPRAWFIVRAALKESGLTWAQADRAMSAAAISAIEGHPGTYATNVIATLGNFLLFRRAFEPAEPAERPPPIDVPGGVYARLHDLQFNSDSAEFRSAEKLYEELKASASSRDSVLPQVRRFQSRVGFLIIYPGIILAFVVRAARRERWSLAVAAGSVLLVFLAYATGGFFQDRYLAGHCFLLSTIAAIGYSSMAEKIRRRTGRRVVSIQPTP
jgi:hypothetical protein